MAEGGDEAAAPVDAVVEAGDHALTIHLRGEKFEGGRLPISALSTLTKMNSMVVRIAKDLEMASRDGAVRASPHAHIELVLVGEIESGSAKFKLLILPLVAALPGPALSAQAELLHSLPDAVPAIVRAVHEGTEIPLPVSAEAVRLAAEVGQNLGANEEMVLSPADVGIVDEAVDEKSATVTLASTNQARTAQDVTDERSFFVTGNLRQLENHGDKPGKLTLATTSGLYPVPSVEVTLVERAAGLLSTDRNVVVAISGRGEFDGKGRLKKLTHLTDMRSVDRHFNPDRRLAELAALSDSPLLSARIERARPVIERAVLATGLAPGLFLDEDDQPEARWIIRPDPGTPARVVNVSFGVGIDVYVFDRATGDVTAGTTFGADEPTPGDLIADIILRTVDGAGA